MVVMEVSPNVLELPHFSAGRSEDKDTSAISDRSDKDRI